MLEQLRLQGMIRQDQTQATVAEDHLVVEVMVAEAMVVEDHRAAAEDDKTILHPV